MAGANRLTFSVRDQRGEGEVMATCASCRYFKPDGYKKGECRRRPPLANHEGTWWPEVANDDWCGDFQRPSYTRNAAPEEQLDDPVPASNAAIRGVSPARGLNAAGKANLMAMTFVIFIVAALIWLSTAKAHAQQGCPHDVTVRLHEGMTITVGRARCENRPMSKPETDRLSRKLYDNGRALKHEGCDVASFDALQQVLNEYREDEDSFCDRARLLIRQHRL